jgi:UDP-N-acetylglucosamine acyltransferase
MIHESAIISKNAEISSDIQIGVNCIIGDNVKIGKKCILKDNVRIVGNTSIGSGNTFFSNSVIGEVPQDKKYYGEKTNLIIGDDNTFREFVTINTGTLSGGGKTIVGSKNWVMSYVHIAHDCNVGDFNTFANCAQLAGHVNIQNNVILGGFTGIHQYCTLGSFSITGISSVILKDVFPFTKVMGNRAKLFGLNQEGIKRAKFNNLEVLDIKNVYKKFFNSSLTYQEAKQTINNLKNPKISEVISSFINISCKGIVR